MFVYFIASSGSSVVAFSLSAIMREKLLPPFYRKKIQAYRDEITLPVSHSW